ncbi:hypothetical protein RFI_05910 [Reticulomyxa filosa]|uniref:DDE-1 domain-containing protein n=1 Tax=Reticulomyxa filosa TaxID=46433 RepID=X6NZ10_RETFI|nr:hypothetical protein RFI_05910 [Reticulomyxa filosa]|eukprot:ETO31211.1 hypothetical protein RFI_05910 [Reticulomyxa filosa]
MALLTENAIIKTSKFIGGRIILWSCFVVLVPGYACKIDRCINADIYKEILSDEMLKSIDWCLEEYFIKIMPQPQSNYVKKWFEQNDIKLLDFPPNSINLNIVENLPFKSKEWKKIDK